MAEFVVNTNILRSEADSIQSVQREMNSITARLMGIQISSFLRSSSTVLLNQRITDCRNAVSNQASNLQKLSNGLDSIALLYDQVEKNLSEPKTQSSSSGSGSESGSESGGSIPEWARNILESLAIPILLNPSLLPTLTTLSLFAVLGNVQAGNLPENWSLLSGETGGSTELWGIPCSGKLSGSLLGYDSKTSWKAKWSPEKGNAGISGTAELNAYLAKGEASGNFGILSGKANASVGNVGVSGSLKATLFENGKFSPALGAEAKAEASVAKGSISGQLGNDNYNAHAKANGTLFGAEASASAQIGKVSYKNDAGDTVQAYGVKGKVGAEAYVASGKVSGGFTFMGIDIDVGVSGKAGGAGVSAGGSITTDGVSGEIGAGLGLGAGVEISIDWTDFDPPTLEDIGEGIQNVGESIGEGLQAAGDFVADAGDWVGDRISDAGEAIGDGIRNAGEAISDFFNW